MYRLLRRLARRNGWEWHAYNSSQVVAAVRPNGCQGWPSKELLRFGVVALYGEELRQADQNIIDAIAVGHLHIGKMKERRLIIVAKKSRGAAAARRR